MGKLTVVVGGQYGSEAKGAATARIARDADQPTVIRVAGPNAGHTAYDANGKAWPLRQIPCAAVTNLDAQLLIGAGSEIDMEVLLDEVQNLEQAGIPIRDRLMVDREATMITDEHKIAEISGHHLIDKIGSTGKGIGAARADRLLRQAMTAGNVANAFSLAGITLYSNSWMLLRERLLGGYHVIIEGTQGYGLGLHAGHYPQCTSSDCRAIDFLAMAGIDPHWADEYDVCVVARTYPIRVAGNSGPLKGETTWENLGIPPERTTVTKKIRRVGMWDGDLVATAVAANGGPRVAWISLSMVDYLVPGLKGFDGTAKQVATDLGEQVYVDMLEVVGKVELETDAEVRLVGTGPDSFVTV